MGQRSFHCQCPRRWCSNISDLQIPGWNFWWFGRVVLRLIAPLAPPVLSVHLKTGLVAALGGILFYQRNPIYPLLIQSHNAYKSCLSHYLHRNSTYTPRFPHLLPHLQPSRPQSPALLLPHVFSGGIWEVLFSNKGVDFLSSFEALRRIQSMGVWGYRRIEICSKY